MARLALLAGLLVACGPADAAALLHLSRTQVSFGRIPPLLPSAVSPVFVTNTGDAPLDVGALTIEGAQAADFAASGTCAPPRTLAPGERCRIDIVATPASRMPFVRRAGLFVHSNATLGNAEVGLDASADPLGTPIFVPAPPYVDFPAQPVGVASTRLTLAITNASPLTFTINQLVLLGGDARDFAWTATCAVNDMFRPGDVCTVAITFTPTAAGPRSTELVTTMTYLGIDGIFRYSVTGVGGGATPVTVVEYYNAALDHYFITWLPAEQANLDAGNTPTRWNRTGQSFRVYTAAQPGTSPVCRYYLPPQFGDSHFFGRGTAECDATGAAHPAFVLEDPAFMHVMLPVAGVCPAGTTPVYRVFSNRPDANHRYLTDAAIRDQMVARGWLAEGDGPDLVVMCAV